MMQEMAQNAYAYELAKIAEKVNVDKKIDCD